MDDTAHIDKLVFSEEFVRDLSVNELDHMRKIVFIPPETREDLSDWIKLFLRLDFPDGRVDPISNSSPMDMIWECYNHARLNDDPNFYRVLYYSCRTGYKTLGAATLEVLMMVLLRRNVAHMAAIVPQSLKAQQYVKHFFGRPVIREFVSRQSERRIEFTRPDGSTNYLQVIACTMAGANFEHVPFMVVDEVDVVPNPEAYEEAKFIPAPLAGQLPITLLTSTRKFSFGLVQREIDEAVETGILIRHWNILDITQACDPSRHRPDLPKITIYRSDETLKAMPEADFVLLTSDKAALYIRDEGYAGCLANCRLFAVCRGRLATCQTSTSPLLKPIDHVISEFRTVSVDKAKAQLLGWKPSKEGMIYTTLDPLIHWKTAAQIAEMIDGVPRPSTFGKVELVPFIAKMVADGALKLGAGIDWGYTHNYVFTLFVVDGQKRSFALECLSVPELELDPLIDMTQKMLEPYGGPGAVMTYPDNAYPAYIKTFRRKGFRCHDFKKDVQGGIEAVRVALMDSAGSTQMFFFIEDEGVKLLWTRMGQYHWKMDAAGKPTDEPDDELDDECDSVRYFAQNTYARTKGVVISTHQDPRADLQRALPATYPVPYENYLQQLVRDTIAKKGGIPAPSKGQKGSLVFSFGDDSDMETVDPINILSALGKKPPSQS